MKLSFNLNIDDWVAFQQYYRGKKTPFYRWAYPSIIGLGIVLVVTNAYHVHLYGVSNITWFSFVILLALLYILYIRKKSLKDVRKAGLNLQQKHPEAFGEMTMNLNENGIDIQSGLTSKSLTWNEMLRFEENGNYFFLFSKKGVVYIIPKRGIENLSSFRNILNNYFPNE